MPRPAAPSDGAPPGGTTPSGGILPSGDTLPSDGTLLALLGSGPADAISLLYDRYQARVYGAALAVCKDEESAAEASLETFLWMRHHAVRLSRCPPVVIERAIELQALSYGRRRAASPDSAG